MEINQLLFWGMFGLFFEIFFTAIANLISKRNFNLMGHTSLWMLPIYSLGLTYGFDFVQYIISNDLYPVVFGSRILGGDAMYGGMPRYKYFANRVLTFYQNIILQIITSYFL